MMLESLVPSLELCQRLEKAGYPQNSIYRWYLNDDWCLGEWMEDGLESYAAPTVGELAVGMPEYAFTLYWEDGRWRCGCDGRALRYRLGKEIKFGDYNSELRNFYDENPANALARLRINLLENKLVKMVGK